MHVTIPAQAPVDEQGQLLHADDVVAQLVLASNNVEAALSAHGLAWADVTEVIVQAIDVASAAAVIDILDGHLAEYGAHPSIAIIATTALPHPAQAVAIAASAQARSRD